MMIWEKLNEDMKTALKGGDKVRLSVVRMLISELKNERIAQGADLDDVAQRKVLASYAKRRKEAIEAARAGGREDVATKEQAEYDITMSYLPKQLSDDELRAAIRKHIESSGASGPGGFGVVMKSVMAELGGQADGKLVSALVRELLG
ncbi:MAG TPA: GatB/YqeY domain-containing protein [Candidatus Krumholzibacteria bacterium]|nr:GatB/YqeY domain-containing protein [Candidatus Krumholzibacteria bacterium]